MIEQDTLIPAQTKAALDHCLAQIRFARATELAQSRRFPEAEELMAPNGVLPGDARALDLLARIAAQQEQFAKARRLWEAAILKSSPCQEYSDCLERVQRLERISSWLDIIVNYLVWPVVFLSIAAIVYALKALK
jgi:tetratricopeptide (TPR) repeat protein